MTAKAAVVGWPIQHSISPVLHTHWINEYGLDAVYDRVAIEPGTFTQRIGELREAGYRGVNVTAPYKEEAFELSNRKHQAATITGAANLLIFTKDNDIGAENTDAFGLSDSLEDALGINSIAGKKVILLGAGGAARGAAFGLVRYGAEQVIILNRSKDRADQIAAHIKKSLPDADLRTGTLDSWASFASDAWLVVNTTSAGMKGNAPLEVDLGVLPKTAAVCDIVYNPLMTSLLKDADARGHQIIDGLGMLMHQAAPSFAAFFQDEMNWQKPKVTPGLRATLVKELQARG
jgi:shikimate dehydrogenase